MRLPSNSTFIGGFFTHSQSFSELYCTKGIPDPPDALLKCLDFTLPASFNSTLNGNLFDRPINPFLSGDIFEDSTNGTFATLLSFASSNTARGGSGISSRLATVYGHAINETNFNLVGYIKASNTPHGPLVITHVTSYLALVLDGTDRRRDDLVDPDPPFCAATWASDKIPNIGNYVLDYQSPVCGSKAPVLVENTETYRATLVFAEVGIHNAVFVGYEYYQKLFGKAYGVDSAAVSDVKVLSKSRFSFSVTSNVASPTDANSCVYTYVRREISANSPEYVLDSYALGSLSLQNGTDIHDGCITSALFSDYENFDWQFTNTNEACGPTDPTTRFRRYFGDDNNVYYNALNAGSGVFNVSLGEPGSNIPHNLGHRDSGDASFVYIRKDLVQNNTLPASATVISTPSIATSNIATSTIAASNVAVSTATATSIDASNITDSSTTSLAVNSSVPASSTAASTTVANSHVVSKTAPSTSALTNNSKSLTTITTKSGAPASTEVGMGSIVKTITPAVAPTASVAPNVFTSQNTDGVSAGNNIYKGDATGLVGVFAAFITAIIFAL